MARILITSGPTREYLDPVRYLTNGSSGRMGAALAVQALARGHQVVVVSGPVAIEYPSTARVVPVVTTAEMLNACREEFPKCDGAIAAAAPCDYAPRIRQPQKMGKSDSPLIVEFEQTPDIIEALGRDKRSDQWTVAFALETHDGIARAREKMNRKHCELIVLNDPTAIDAESVRVRFIDRQGDTREVAGTKLNVASALLDHLDQMLGIGVRPVTR